MSQQPLRLLVVEHAQADAALSIAELERAGFAVTAEIVDTPETLRGQLLSRTWDLLLAAHLLPGWTGMDALRIARELGFDLPLILVSGTLGEELAVECVKQGAADYIRKQNRSRLPLAVRRALADARALEEHRRAETLIRKLTLAVEQSPAAVIITDTSGTIEYVNRRFSETTGYSPQEALGRNPRMLQSGQTPAAVYQDMWAHLQDGRVWTGELQNRKKNGEFYWHAVTISPVRDAAGNVISFLGIQEDLTEQKLIEARLREREMLFRQLSDHIKEVFFIMDADYRETLYVNSAYEEVWGRSRASLYESPLSFFDGIWPEDKQRVLEYFRRIRTGEHAGELEFRVALGDGKERWVLSQAVPIRNERGEVDRISGVALDITARKEAEHAFRESERRLRTLLETVNLVVLGLDRAGRVEYANPFFLQLTGYTAADLMGASWVERFIPKAEQARMSGVLHELIEEALHPHFRNAILTKSGEERTIAWHNTVLRDAKGHPAGTLSIGEDITEHAKLEEQFRQAQKMEAVGRLAGGVAHDFNNLLTVITSYGELLREDLPLNDPRSADLDSILQAADAAARLTRQLLAFSRQQVIQPRAIALEEVVAQSAKLLQRVVGEDVELVTLLNPQPPTIFMDPGQLEQVIMNLAVNARDAMPDGGQLTLETSVVEFDEENARAHWPALPGRFAMLAMSDTGIGMNAATRARIFDPFFTTKEPGKGTGLGLATVYGVVKQSAGFIWVYSEPGRGTTFKVYIPCTDAAKTPEAVRPASGTLRGSETILLAEDADAVRSAARDVLIRYGYSVLEVSRGRAAVELAAKHDGPIHLLLTDVVMPEMSGRELVDRVRALRPEVRILYMSGYTDDAIVRHGVLAPGIAYLQKPFTPEALARKVRETLDTPLDQPLEQSSAI